MVYYGDLPWCKNKLTKRKLEGCLVDFDRFAVGPRDPPGSRRLGQKSAVVCQEQGLSLTSSSHQPSPGLQTGEKTCKMCGDDQKP